MPYSTELIKIKNMFGCKKNMAILKNNLVFHAGDNTTGPQARHALGKSISRRSRSSSSWRVSATLKSSLPLFLLISVSLIFFLAALSVIYIIQLLILSATCSSG